MTHRDAMIEDMDLQPMTEEMLAVWGEPIMLPLTPEEEERLDLDFEF